LEGKEISNLGRITPRDREVAFDECERATFSVVIAAHAGIQCPKNASDESRGCGVLDRPVKPGDDS
jgi:hypothetical protein